MPISKDEFRSMDEDGVADLDLSPDTTQGKIYRLLVENGEQAFRQREIADRVDVPRGSIGPTLARLAEADIVEHRGRYWSVSDTEHAVASAGRIGARTADSIDGGFDEQEIERWMETAVDPMDSYETDDGEA